MPQFAPSAPSATTWAAFLAMAASATTNPVLAQDATKVAAPSAPAAVMQLSAADCRAFAGIATDVINTVGRENVSDAFVKAVIDFAVKRQCTGPYSIPARGKDIDAFVAIDGILGSNNIFLDKIGVRSVRATAALTQ